MLHKLSLLSLGMALACGGDEPPKPPTNANAKPAATAGAPATAAPSSSAAVARAPDLPPLPVRDFQETDFSETERNRDPFRGFAGFFMAQAKSKIELQRPVLVDRFALDELKLIGVVDAQPPRALLSDPTGFGWVAKVGDFIGKPELVHSGGAGGPDVAINWRVDRIRESDVVFVREDPSHPEIPPTTRVIAMHSPDEDLQRGPH